jgi:hypothetical protein
MEISYCVHCGDKCSSKYCKNCGTAEGRHKIDEANEIIKQENLKKGFIYAR